jgi:polyhydroxyalkanoate synthesis regulator phasin
MDNKKFEQLIDLIINENEEQAKALFHDIVVEKSREIYESMMDEEGMMNQPSGQVQDLLDEIGSEEQGMAEAEDEEFDIADMDDDGEEAVDIEMDSEEGGEEGLEDRVVDLEDKLDQLMAEFEEIMGGDDMGDMGDEEGEMDDMDGNDDMGGMDDMDGEEDPMMEAITLKKVSVTHGDNGVQTKSTNLNNSGQAGMDSKPVKFSGASESVPTGPKGPTNAYAKGETSVKGAGSFKNAPAQNNFSEKGESTPKPVTKDEAGKVRSPVAESRKAPAKRRI